MIKRDNPWVTLSRERRYEDRYLGVDLDQLRHESGREHPHVALRFKVFGVAVLPVAIILLAGAALMLFFSQKNLLVDLQITRNGYVSRIAYAAADSGLALAMSRP